MITDNLTENKEIAKQYKELLRISYQSLSDSDKRIIKKENQVKPTYSIR